MSSQIRPLLDAKDVHAEASSRHDGSPTKLPYRAPELRELGAVAELTYTGGGSPSPYYDGQGYPS